MSIIQVSCDVILTFDSPLSLRLWNIERVKSGSRYYGIESNYFSDTGIKEACALNDVRHYQCKQKVIVDIMHDLPEWVLAYETGMTFNQLILVDKIIDFHILNSILLHFDYQFESCIPPGITIDQLKNKFIKISAAEMFTFFPYAQIMFGHFVLEDNTYWELFLKIRLILSLLRSKQFDLECLNYLEDFIADHRVHYIQLFGPLKPKHHFMTHYPLIIKKMGPSSHIHSTRSEYKHRQQKSTSNSVPTRFNICKTIAIKQQLMFVNRLLLNKGSMQVFLLYAYRN